MYEGAEEAGQELQNELFGHMHGAALQQCCDIVKIRKDPLPTCAIDAATVDVNAVMLVCCSK